MPASIPVVHSALGYFNARFGDLGWPGIDRLIADNEPSPQAAADLLRAAPASEQGWNRLDLFGPEIAAEYWSRVTPGDLGHPDELEQLLNLSRLLRTAGRLELVAHVLTTPSQDHSAELAYAEEAAEFLAQRVRHPDVGGVGSGVMQRWELASLFEVLDKHREQLGVRRVALLEWQYYPLLEYESGFIAPNLYREMARDPDAADGEAVAGRREFVAEASLNSWVERARIRLTETGRADIGDQQIGAALAATPADPNGDWPGIAMRDLLERLQSPDIDNGISMTLYNRRCVTARGITEGGTQERELAEDYRARGRKCQEWPRTAAIFAGLARGYEREAEVEDRAAEAHRRGLPL